MYHSRVLLFLTAILVATTQLASAAEQTPSPTVGSQSTSLMAAAPLTATTTPGTFSSPLSIASNPEPIPPGSELTLKQAVSIALRYHPRLQEAAAQSDAAREQIGEARSYLGPQVFGAAQYLRSTENGIGNTEYYNPEGAFPRLTGRNHDLPSNDFTQSWDTSNNYMGGVSLSQFLFDFGRRYGFVSERRFEADAAAATQQLTEMDLIFEASQRYFDLLQARQLIRVYEKALEQRKYHLHEADVKARAGLRPELDVYVTQAEVQRAQLHLVDARNAAEDAKVALDNAMGLSDSAPDYEPAEVLTYAPINASLKLLLKQAFVARPDLKTLEDQARAMGARIVQYQSDYYPTVNAVGGYSALGTGTPAANNFNVGIVITWPIFNSFLTRDEVAEARYRQQAIQRGVDDLRQEITLQVHTAFLDWQASLERITRAEKALAASRAELELAEKRYETGLTDVVELEDAQRHYTDDDAAYTNALYGYSATKAAVDRATAESLSEF